ncbi:MAG TPA: HDIG domain-containing protein [Acidimicrobiia bacterium]|nr:HDIG domain-containing protein [Acidimicrobiia bacterium]
MQRSTLVRSAIFLSTVVAAWAVLSLGSAADTPPLEVGALAPQPFFADRTEVVVDEAETERLRQEARDAVPPPRETDTEVENTVTANVRLVFDDLQILAVGEPPVGPPTSTPELPPTTTTTPADEGEAAAEPTEPAVITGVVFIDVDGDGAFNPDTGEQRVDRGLSAVSVEITTHDGTVSVVTADQGGWVFEYPGGPVVIEIDNDDPEIPRGYLVNTGNPAQLIECPAEETCQAENIGFGVNLRPITEMVDSITATHPLPEEKVLYLATVAADDVVRNALGLPLHITTIQTAAITEATLRLAGRIVPEDLQTVKANVRSTPPFVFHTDTGPDEQGGMAAAEIVATNLQANYLINQELLSELQSAAADDVDPVTVEYTEDQLIVDQNVPMTALHIAAIEQTSAPTIEEQPSSGLMAVVTVMVGLIGVYLATFRPEFWARPRMVALLGIMVVLGAGAVRGTVALEESFSWYVMPAVAFGFITAVLFDQRIGILMALAVGVLAALGTLDPGVTVYAILAALAPIPFVSAVSSRGSFRNAVILSSIVAASVAAATSWFFHVGPNDAITDVVGLSVAWAFGVSVGASLLGLAALQFFEAAFDITTTLGLLDLTDRNHKALQMLQEEAFGTFNHSLMVGTLADAAARSIGANALLARAMAYYHDLGKTENPTLFIENQFGMSNPHDDLDPEESAQVIRDHVTAGVALARQYNIPSDVAEGIVSHHGDGVMRYFYEKARRQRGDEVDIDDFRHIGHKPHTAESAILMLADSLEAACRAVFQSEEPSPDAIEKVVDRIMDEKMEDGQLSESPVTLGELSKIRRAFLDSLIGHYHQRIAYPNFPGS